MKTFYRISFLLISLLAGIFTEAQTRVSLLTFGPGKPVYTLEGHSALRLQLDDGRDITINWGIFDFNDPRFEWKFMKGETDYLCGAAPTSMVLAEYRGEGREVVEQPLVLTPEQTDILISLVDKNLLPENRRYRYRYLSDNCATRPLNIIEQAIRATGDSLMFNIPVEGEESTTFRKELAGYHRNNSIYQLFIDIALGREADREITTRQRAFAPLFLSKLISEANVIDPENGKVWQLSPGKPITLVEESAEARGSEPPAILIAVGLLLWAFATWLWELHNKRVCRWSNALFFLLYGLLGVMVTFLVFWSEQEATGRNPNLVWLNPVLLLVPMLIWSKRCQKFLRWCYILFVIATACFLLNLTWSNGTSASIIVMAVAELLMSGGYLATTRQRKEEMQ